MCLPPFRREGNAGSGGGSSWTIGEIVVDSGKYGAEVPAEPRASFRSPRRTPMQVAEACRTGHRSSKARVGTWPTSSTPSNDPVSPCATRPEPQWPVRRVPGRSAHSGRITTSASFSGRGTSQPATGDPESGIRSVSVTDTEPPSGAASHTAADTKYFGRVSNWIESSPSRRRR